jgi:hypothetical protein
LRAHDVAIHAIAAHQLGSFTGAGKRTLISEDMGDASLKAVVFDTGLVHDGF